MDNEKINQENSTETVYVTEDRITLRDLFFMCLEKWYIVAICVVIALFGALYSIKSTAPVFQRAANLVIKQDRRSGNTGIDNISGSFSNMGNLFSQQSNVYNEMIAFQSPYLMMEVVKKLDLRANYSVKKGLYRMSLYKSTLPVYVSMIGLKNDDSFGMYIEYEDDSHVNLSDMYKYIGPDKVEFDDITVALGDTVQTGLGTLVVLKGDAFPKEGDKPFKDIKLTYSSLQGAVNAYTAKLTVGLADNDATVISMSFNDTSIKRAEDVLQGLIDIYNEKWVSERNELATNTALFINDRLEKIEKDLADVDSDISSFKQENKILDPAAMASVIVDQANKNQLEYFALNNSLQMAQYVRDYIESPDGRTKLLPANIGLNESGIEKLISEYNTNKMMRDQLALNSSEQSPIVQDMDRNLESMRSSILSSINQYEKTTQEKLKTLSAQMDATDERIASSPSQTKYLISVERQQKVKEALYIYLLQKREENELSKTFTSYNTRIITPPMGSNRPVSPKPMRILLIALVLGIGLPVAYIYLVEATNTKVRGKKDLESITTPCVGEIPLAYNRNSVLSFFKKNADKDEICVKPMCRNVINEAFRIVRANLEFMCTSTNSRIIQMSSFNPGSGKTFISINLATALAIKQQRVMVVDLDMRKATLSSYVGKPKTGVAAYLSGKVDNISDIILKDKTIKNLDIIPVGTIPPNPAELLYSDKLETLMTELRKMYDIIIIDCPPADIVADAAIINKYVDRTLFVVRAGLLEREMLPEIDRYYRNNKYTGMMLLLNGTDTSTSFVYKNGGYGYGRYAYAYGHGYGKYGGYDEK